MKFLESDFVHNLIPMLVVVSLLWALTAARSQPLWAEAYRRIGKSKLGLVAVIIISLYGGIAFLDSVGKTDPQSQEFVTILDNLAKREPEKTYSVPLGRQTFGEPKPQTLKAPGKHLLGTDGVGQDILYRTLKGARTAFFIGGLTTLFSTPVALLLGMSAGYYGKRVDDAIVYVYTVLGSIPSILLQIALVIVLGKGLWQICVALGVTQWVGLCRLARGETLKHREREYVRAAKSLGVSDLRLLMRHILPNLLPIIIISMTLSFSGLVLSESILSYLGIGVDAGTGSWGNMIDSARNELARTPIIWWNVASASSALLILVLAFNLLGDVLRDAIDPRLRS